MYYGDSACLPVRPSCQSVCCQLTRQTYNVKSKMLLMCGEKKETRNISKENEIKQKRTTFHQDAFKGVGNGQTDGQRISLIREALTYRVSYSCHYLSYLSVRSSLCSSICLSVCLSVCPPFLLSNCSHFLSIF